MLLQELIGKKITNIFQVIDFEDYGLDKGECFVELDHKTIIDMPHGFQSFNDEVWTKETDEGTVSIFSDLSEHLGYCINKEGKSIVEKHSEKKPSFVEKVKQFLFGKKLLNLENRKTKLDYIQNSVIKDLITFGDDFEKYFLELENGYFIGETNFSMNGTGKVGINLYESLEEITNWKGKEFKRLSDKLK